MTQFGFHDKGADWMGPLSTALGVQDLRVTVAMLLALPTRKAGDPRVEIGRFVPLA